MQDSGVVGGLSGGPVVGTLPLSLQGAGCRAWGVGIRSGSRVDLWSGN